MYSRAILFTALLSTSALADEKAPPAHWTRITEEKGKRFIFDGCDTGIQTADLSATQLEFDFGQDSETYEVASVSTLDEGFNVTIKVKEVFHLVLIRYENRKKGLARFSSNWDQFRGAGLYVSEDMKKHFKVVKEPVKNCEG